MQELVHQNKKQVLSSNKKYCLKSTLMQQSSLILQVPLISEEKDCVPFWNKHCLELQSALWLPHKTESQDQVLDLSKGSSNYQEEVLSHLMTKLTPKKNLTQPNLSHSLLPSVIAITENKAQEGKIIATKKIRIFPKNINAYQEALTLHRRAYNLAMERYINNDYKDKDGKIRNLRPEIKTICIKEQQENGRIYHSDLVANGVLNAKQTFSTVLSNNKSKKGQKTGFSSLKFKSKKGVKHTFKIDRLPKSGKPCKSVLGDIEITEAIPSEAYGKTALITCDKGRWFINVQQHISINSEIQGGVKCVSIDPGVRTFATTFAEKEALVVGNDFVKEKLFPLMKKVDDLISQKQKIKNKFLKIKWSDLPQWCRDRITYFDKEINRLKCKKEDLVNDLHHRFAYYLISNYDCIFLPKFETKQMVKRKGNVRTIRRNTARQMLDLGHCRFKMLLKWYAKKYGKKVIDCNEAYTSKTYSWNGFINEKLSGKKIIKDEGMIVDRDINGARNIFIKCLTRTKKAA